MSSTYGTAPYGENAYGDTTAGGDLSLGTVESFASPTINEAITVDRSGDAGVYGLGTYGDDPYGSSQAINPTVSLGTVSATALPEFSEVIEVAESLSVEVSATPRVRSLSSTTAIELNTVTATSNTTLVHTVDTAPLETWRVDSIEIEPLLSERSTWNTLMLETQVTEEVYQTKLREVEENAGKVGKYVSESGEFHAMGQAGGENEYTLTPPDVRGDLRDEGTWYCDRFRKQRVDKRGDRFQISMTFVPDYSKSLSPPYINQLPSASAEWEFSLQDAAITTRRVRAEIEAKTKQQITELSLRLLLDREQTVAWEDHCSRTGSVRDRLYPDGTNTVEDVSPDTRNSVYIDPPQSSASIDEGSYRVKSWETQWVGDNAFEVYTTVVRVETGEKATADFDPSEGTLN